MRNLIFVAIVFVLFISFSSCKEKLKITDRYEKFTVESDELVKFEFYYHSDNKIKVKSVIHTSYRMEELIGSYTREFKEPYSNLDSITISQLSIRAWCHILPVPEDKNWDWEKEDGTLEWGWTKIKTITPAKII